MCSTNKSYAVLAFCYTAAVMHSVADCFIADPATKTDLAQTQILKQGANWPMRLGSDVLIAKAEQSISTWASSTHGMTRLPDRLLTETQT